MADQTPDRMARRSDLSDGSLRGTTGPMAKIPWSDLPLLTEMVGSGAALGATRAEQQDGGTGPYTVSLGATLPQSNGVATVVKCTGVGIRFRQSSGSNQPPVDLIVDGRCVEAARTSKSRVLGLNTGSYTDYEMPFEWPFALKPAPHTVQVRIDGDPAGAVSYALPFTGWLLPRADGFRDVATTPRKGALTTRQTLTTTAASLSTGTADQFIDFLHFVNTDTGGAHVVTIYREDGTTIYDQISVPIATATQVGVKDYPICGNLVSWKFKVDSGSTTTMEAKTR